ncbi:MAG: DUF5711 family protein [Clostridiales bacterium]|jgi:hypothetical protein|nr:DUF5711 family protein [Clostridiales bacterium]
MANRENTNYENTNHEKFKREKPKKNTAVKIAALVILIAAVGIYLYLGGRNKDAVAAFEFDETDAAFDFNYDEKADIYSNGTKNFFLTTKDGMNLYTSGKEVKWTQVYPLSLKEPLMAGRGDYVGICDANGLVFYMFSAEDGLLFSKNYENKILSFSVSPGGYSSVICKDGEDYTVQAFNAKGDEINCYYVRDENIFPVTSAISNDGRILAISLIDINASVMTSKLMMLYNNSGEKQEFLNGIFHQESREDEFIGKLEFLAKGELLFLSDKNLSCMSTELTDFIKPALKWELPLSNEVDSVAVAKGETIAVAFGKPVPGKEAVKEGLVRVYNPEFHQLGEYEYNGAVSLSSSGSFIVASCGRKHSVINSKGKMLWEYNAVSDVKKLAVLDNQNTAVFLDNLHAQVIKKR